MFDNLDPFLTGKAQQKIAFWALECSSGRYNTGNCQKKKNYYEIWCMAVFSMHEFLLTFWELSTLYTNRSSVKYLYEFLLPNFVFYLAFILNNSWITSSSMTFSSSSPQKPIQKNKWKPKCSLDTEWKSGKKLGKYLEGLQRQIYSPMCNNN